MYIHTVETENIFIFLESLKLFNFNIVCFLYDAILFAVYYVSCTLLLKQILLHKINQAISKRKKSPGKEEPKQVREITYYELI